MKLDKNGAISDFLESTLLRMEAESASSAAVIPPLNISSCISPHTAEIKIPFHTNKHFLLLNVKLTTFSSVFIRCW